jgi:hypothetical protein
MRTGKLYVQVCLFDDLVLAIQLEGEGPVSSSDCMGIAPDSDTSPPP